jgi:Cu+-exporting ATPase
VLIRSPEVLETTSRLDTVVLDKTGTLTEGRPALVAVTAAAGENPGDVLRLAALVESASEHPVARAIVAGARDRGADVPPDAAASVVAVPGRGITATVAGRRVTVGRPSWSVDQAAVLPPALADALADEESRGRTVMAVTWDGRVRGVLAVADTVRPTSTAAVSALRDLGLRPVLVTGDNPATAAVVAAQVGIDPVDVIAGVLPEGKSAEVARLRAEGRTVAVVGDGVNDAPALAAADLGMAMGSGAEVAVEAADVTLVRPDPMLAATAVRLSRATLRIIRQNLFWAFAYNVAAIPLAALGLLNPMIAGLAMAASSVLVVTNSLRLRRVRA